MKLQEVPVLDCSKIAGELEEIENTEEFKEFAQKLGDGMSQVGFVYFINHGVDSSIVGNVLEKSRQFFQLPTEVKQKFKKVDPVENFFGYTSSEEEILTEGDKSKPDYKESFDFWGSRAFDEKSYPSEVPELKPALDEFRNLLGILTKKILRSFAVYLKLDDLDFFINEHKHLFDHSVSALNNLRSNYYMPILDKEIEIGENDMRCSEHNDWGTVTFLVQDDCGGLEARMFDGEWISVPPLKDSIVLNAGLMLEMWSGGHFPATLHRVRMVKDTACKLRQSVAYFILPEGDSRCFPIISEKSDWKPLYPKMEKENYAEYFRNRVRGTRVY